MDAIAEYKGAVELYADGFSQLSEREYDNASMMVDVWTVALEQHEKTKPAFWKPQDEWLKEKESLEYTLAESVKKSGQALEVWKGGDSHPEAIKYAQGVIEKEHPELHAAYHEAFETLPPPSDAIEVYSKTLELYKEAYLARAEHDHQSYRQLADEWASCSEAHCYVKPDIVENIVTLGKAGREWEAQNVEINEKLGRCQEEVKTTWDVISAGASHPDVVKYAEDTVKNRHPEIERNFQKAVSLQKQAEQAERQRELHDRMAEIASPNRDAASVEVSR